MSSYIEGVWEKAQEVSMREGKRLWGNSDLEQWYLTSSDAEQALAGKNSHSGNGTKRKRKKSRKCDDHQLEEYVPHVRKEQSLVTFQDV